MSRRGALCGRGWEMGQSWKPARGIGSSMNYAGNFFILPAFCRQFPCLSYLFFFLCSYLISSSSTVSKGCDKLQSFNSVMGNARICLSHDFSFFVFFFIRRRNSEFLFLAVGWAPAAGRRCSGGLQKVFRLGVIQANDQNMHLESCQAAQHSPKATLGVVLFCWTYCFFTATASLFSEEAFQGSTAALAVCEVLASVRPQLWRTVLQEWCSFWVVFFWSPLF